MDLLFIAGAAIGMLARALANAKAKAMTVFAEGDIEVARERYDIARDQADAAHAARMAARREAFARDAAIHLAGDA